MFYFFVVCCRVTGEGAFRMVIRRSVRWFGRPPRLTPDGIERKLLDQGIDRQLRVRPRHGCGSDIPEIPPVALSSILKLFLLAYYTHESSRIRKLPPTIETADVIEPVAAMWCLDGRSQIRMQGSTLPRSWSPPTRTLKNALHQLEVRSRSPLDYSSQLGKQSLSGIQT
jgi:hypothetical protein